jgi:hypothetical protein
MHAKVEQQLEEIESLLSVIPTETLEHRQNLATRVRGVLDSLEPHSGK